MTELAAPDSHRLQSIGGYTVVRVIGEGGMGIVYEAVERLSKRRVALKVLHSSLAKSAEARARFFEEMRIMATLDHPNIVRSLSARELDGRLVMVLELLEGRTLREELETSGRIAPARALEIASQVASALTAAHHLDPPIVHRDLKPENLMILADGSVKVMDFGVAKVLGRADAGALSTHAVGTVEYMSPEQAEGQPITAKTDLYALGLVMYEMLSGGPPFSSESMLEILTAQCERPPPPLPDHVRAALSPRAQSLLASLLAKAPADRPADAGAVVAALSGTGQGVTPVTSAPTAAFSGSAAPAVPKPNLDTVVLLDKFERRARWQYAVAAVLALVVAGAAAFVIVAKPFSTAPSKKARPTASASTAPSAPVALDLDCPYNFRCTPFVPADPARVDSDLVLAEGLKFARSVDPGAKLSRINASHILNADGTVDLSRGNINVNLDYNRPDGSGLRVQVSATRLSLIELHAAMSTGALIGPCSLRKALESAQKDGFPIDGRSDALLFADATTGIPTWILRTGGESALLDGATCVVQSNSVANRQR